MAFVSKDIPSANLGQIANVMVVRESAVIKDHVDKSLTLVLARTMDVDVINLRPLLLLLWLEFVLLLSSSQFHHRLGTVM